MRGKFTHQFFIESFGVKIGITTNSEEAVALLKKAVEIYLPDCFTEIEKTKTAHNFKFVWNVSEKDTLYLNGERIFARQRRETSIDGAASRIRLTVAEFAVDRVFIHAGVVAWKGKAVIIPGRSYSGKTSLTVALVKRGAVYYSDEFAILDAEGFLHPFPKLLSVRGIIDERKQVDLPVETFGGTAGTQKIRVGIVLITQFQKGARWNPQILSAAKGLIEILKDTVAIRQNPHFTLEVLNKIVSEAIIVKSKRDDEEKSAGLILKFIEDNL